MVTEMNTSTLSNKPSENSVSNVSCKNIYYTHNMLGIPRIFSKVFSRMDKYALKTFIIHIIC